MDCLLTIAYAFYIFSIEIKIRIGLKAALNGGVSDPRNVTIMKMFSLVDIGERAGSGIPDFMYIWKTFVEETPVYSVTRNPDRTTLVIPFTQEALRNVGKKVASVRQSTSQSTSQSIQSTSQSTNEEELSETAKDILNLIRQNPRITYDEIASSLGKARSGIARHLKSMQKAGIIQPKNEYGQWIVLIGK